MTAKMKLYVALGGTRLSKITLSLLRLNTALLLNQPHWNENQRHWFTTDMLWSKVCDSFLPFRKQINPNPHFLLFMLIQAAYETTWKCCIWNNMKMHSIYDFGSASWTRFPSPASAEDYLPPWAMQIRAVWSLLPFFLHLERKLTNLAQKKGTISTWIFKLGYVTTSETFISLPTLQ